MLPNYPNPFKPEIWIPNPLSNPHDATLAIYDIEGKVVRTLDLEHQHAGLYQTNSCTAYWNSRNTAGENVACGVYSYTLTAGELTEKRKMLIIINFGTSVTTLDNEYHYR